MRRIDRPEERLQFSLRTMFAAMSLAALAAAVVPWLMAFPLVAWGGFTIGVSVAVFSFLLLGREEIRTILLQLLVAMLVGTYALWLPDQFLFYVSGVGVGLLCTWQGPALLTALCAVLGISKVKVYEVPKWHPSRRSGGSLSDTWKARF